MLNGTINVKSYTHGKEYRTIVAVKQASLLHRILEVLDSNLGLKTGYSEVFAGFLSPTSKFT
jgi:hypothetical protein